LDHFNHFAVSTLAERSVGPKRKKGRRKKGREERLPLIGVLLTPSAAQQFCPEKKKKVPGEKKKKEGGSASAYS